MVILESWFLIAFLSTIFTSIGLIIEKKTLIKEHAMEFGTVLSIMIAALLLPFFLKIDYSILTLSLILFILLLSILQSLGLLFTIKCFRHLGVGEATSLMVMNPGITAILAFLILGESLGIFQVLGIVLIIFGAYFLELKDKQRPLDPFRFFIENKNVHFILLGSLFFAGANIVMRYIFEAYAVDTTTVVAFTHLFIALVFIFMLNAFHDGFKGVKNGFSRYWKWVFLTAVFLLAGRFALYEAVRLEKVGLPIAVRRLMALFTIVLGGRIFHEKDIMRKLIAATIMILGVILLLV